MCLYQFCVTKQGIPQSFASVVAYVSFGEHNLQLEAGVSSRLQFIYYASGKISVVQSLGCKCVYVNITGDHKAER